MDLSFETTEIDLSLVKTEDIGLHCDESALFIKTEKSDVMPLRGESPTSLDSAQSKNGVIKQEVDLDFDSTEVCRCENKMALASAAYVPFESDLSEDDDGIRNEDWESDTSSDPSLPPELEEIVNKTNETHSLKPNTQEWRADNGKTNVSRNLQYPVLSPRNHQLDSEKNRPTSVPCGKPLSPNYASTSSVQTSIRESRKSYSRSKRKNSQTKISTHKRKSRSAKTKNCYEFKENDFYWPVEVEERTFTTPDYSELPSEISYFKRFFTDDLMSYIIDETNRYCFQLTGETLNFDRDDLENFLYIEILMGIVKFPAYTDYWSPELRFDKIASVMPLEKYQRIRRFLHFADNTQTTNDRYYKIRSVLGYITDQFREIENESRQSIGEMIIPFKGPKESKHLVSKPKKWGLKFFVRAGESGMIYDLIVYDGEDTFQFHDLPPAEERMSFGAKIVLSLCKTIPNPALTAVYFGNIFTSLKLLERLRTKYGILAIGAVRSKRINSDVREALRKTPGGTILQRADNKAKLVVVKWRDRKEVVLVSNFIGAEPVDEIQRFSREEEKLIDVPCPQAVKDYNSHKGGVDTTNKMVALHRTSWKPDKWYLKMFSHLMDLCLINAWLLRHRDAKLLGVDGEQSLKIFKLRVAQGLLHMVRLNLSDDSFPTQIILKPRTKHPVEDVRYDCLDHFPLRCTKGRCRYCKNGQSRIKCMKCSSVGSGEWRLCLENNRNCFYGYHHK